MKPFPRPLAASLKAALRDTPVACLLGPRQDLVAVGRIVPPANPFMFETFLLAIATTG